MKDASRPASALLGWRRHRHLANQPNRESWALIGGAAALLLIAIGGIGAPRQWWGRNLELTLHTTSAAGLSPSMEVKIAGYPVGRVQRIQLLNSGRVLVKLTVEASRANLIGPRSQVLIEQDSLLGRPYIALGTDPQSTQEQQRQLQHGLNLAYKPAPGIPALINELAGSRLALQQGIEGATALVQKRLPRSLDQLDRTLQGGQQLTTSLQQDLGGLRQELVGEASALAADLRNTSTNLNQTLSQLQSTLQQVHALAASSNQLLGNLNRSWLLQLLQPADEPQLRNKRE